MMRASLTRWASILLGVLAAATIGGVALAGAPAELPPAAGNADFSAAQADEPEVEGDVETEDEGEGHEVENHGRCVSQAAHAANEAGIRGPARGAFMRAVAEDESMVAPKGELGDSCDFADALTEAEAAAASHPSSAAHGEGGGQGDGPGRSAEAKARAAEKRAANAGTGEETD